MKDYSRALIREQISRGLCLKKLVPHPLEHQELSSLAERCRGIIDDRIQELECFEEILDTRRENDVEDLFRGIRRCAREIEMVEYFGIPGLYYETEEIAYLNKLIFRIHREINLPFSPPSVACISTNYYYFHPFTNVIFLPLGESYSLLHLPDMFHEIGHAVLFNIEKELRLKKVREDYHKAIQMITDHYQEILTRKVREFGPRTIPPLVMHIHSQWKEYWVSEFFCDLFALYTLGPAYAWSHFHLTAKKSVDIYDFPLVLQQRHPSDDSRMRMLAIGLDKLGFGEEAESILSRWKTIPFVARAQPPAEYQYAYPDNVIEEVASLFLGGLSQSGFSIAFRERLKDLGEESIVKLLNDAWIFLWENPKMFREWEEKRIQELKSSA